MPDETKPITREEWDEWRADRRTMALLKFIDGCSEDAAKKMGQEREKFPHTDRDRFFEFRGERGAFRWCASAIRNTGAPPQPTGTDDTDKVGADGRRIHVKG